MKPVEIFIYDCIVGEDAGTVIQQIRSAGTAPIDVRLNSPGGDVFASYAIYNALLLHAPGVSVYIDGLAASIASYIAMAGRKIYMAENAMMMIHNPTQFIGGDADDMRRSANLLDKCAASITDAYERRTKLPRARIVAMMEDETWLTPDMAKELGFIDGITASLQAVARFDVSKFRHPPKAITNNPFKNIIALLVAALPGQITLTSSPAANVETGVKTLVTQCADFQGKLLTFTQSIAALVMAALPGKVTRTSEAADIQAAIGVLVNERDSYRHTIINFPKVAAAALTAALPGKVNLTEASPIGDIENALKLLIAERDGFLIKVADLAVLSARATKNVGLIESYAKAHHLDISGIDPDAPSPIPAVSVLNVAEYSRRIREAKTTQKIEAVIAEWESAVEAQRADNASRANPET